MTNAELNQLSISELREVNRKVVEIIKLKMQFEGKLNADNLQKGMTVKYKGSSDKLQGQKFVIEKISKVNAQCKSLKDNRTWNINLANIEPCNDNAEIVQNNSTFSNNDIGLLFCNQVGTGKGFWIENYNEEQKNFFLSIGFKEDRKALNFKSVNEFAFYGWTDEEEKRIHSEIRNHFGFTQIKTKLMSFADMI